MKSAKLKKLNFLFIVLLFVLAVIIPLIFQTQPSNFWAIGISTLLIFLFALWHALLKFGWKNTVIFLIIALIISFASEYVGVKWGHLFGGGYRYSENILPKILGIPIIVMLMWLAILYITYQIAEHIADFKFTKKISIGAKVVLSACTAILTGLATVGWDLAMDPLASRAGWWTWYNYDVDQSFMNVPYGNFIGWIIVSFLVVFIFKIFFAKEKTEKETLFEFAPAVSYGLIWLTTFVWALEYKMPNLAIISIITMWPLIVILIIRFFSNLYKLPDKYKK